MTAIADSDCGLANRRVAACRFNQQVAVTCRKIHLDGGIRSIHQYPACLHGQVYASGLLDDAAGGDADLFAGDAAVAADAQRTRVGAGDLARAGDADRGA